MKVAKFITAFIASFALIGTAYATNGPVSAGSVMSSGTGSSYSASNSYSYTVPTTNNNVQTTVWVSPMTTNTQAQVQTFALSAPYTNQLNLNTSAVAPQHCLAYGACQAAQNVNSMYAQQYAPQPTQTSYSGVQNTGTGYFFGSDTGGFFR